MLQKYTTQILQKILQQYDKNTTKYYKNTTTKILNKIMQEYYKKYNNTTKY